MKKVLIITYYWPPSGGAGVQRWLKFVKYLRDFGYEPIIYTPSNGEMPVEDLTLLKDIPASIEILQQPIWEPYSVYKTFVGQKKEEKINTGFLTENKKPGLSQKLSVWIRGNFFIPDARRFWVKPSVKFLRQYISNHPIDAIVSTGPPHSMHLIARALHQKTAIPWLADFRDPWTKIDFYKDLMLTSWADAIHHKLELAVLREANRVVTVSPTLTAEMAILAGANKVVTITNGYDQDDLKPNDIPLDQVFSIAHIGTLVKTRNPLLLWEVIVELIDTLPEFSNHLQIKLVGKVDLKITQTLEDKGLLKYVKRIDYLPHDQITAVQQQSQVLLLVINDTPNSKGILTGKLFEYLSAKRPIIGIGPVDGDAAQVLNETGAGQMFSDKHKSELKEYLTNCFLQFKLGKLKVDNKNIEGYSRRELTRKLVNELNAITS